jgi:anti-sigma regulatory factor (Ser/Thr protein kinase)
VTVDTGTATQAPGNLFEHPALLYRDTTEYLAGTLPFIHAGLDAGQPVMVAVPGHNLDLIRDGLGADAARVQLHDMSVAGRNPGRIIPGVLLAFAAQHSGTRVRIIGEPIWPGRTPMEYPACTQHEALINAAFTGRDAAILCPYDTVHLDQRAVDDAHRTHPVMTTANPARGAAATRTWDSEHYADPTIVAADFNQPLPDPPPGAATMAVGHTALRAVRRFTIHHATSAGLGAVRTAELTLAVNELAANTIQHTEAGTGTLALWNDERNLVCQISDTGHISDPLAGRIPPPIHSAAGGRGLILVNHLCDLVRIHTRPGATTIRIHVHR